MNREIVLVDLSSIIYPIWHMSASEPDPDHCSKATIARVHRLASGHPHVAICCDSGRSFRHDVDPTYKANRPEKNETLKHQMRLVTEALEADGFPVWSVPGFEADDLIASAVARALALPDAEALIVTGDKDLLQLVGPRVRAKSARDGSICDAAGVVEKFGVRPEQIADYLCLVGDTSDNVKGANGIGPKKAVALLARFGSLDALYEDMVEVGPAQMGLKPAETAALKEFKGRLEQTRKLIGLCATADIPFDAVLGPRESQAAIDFAASVQDEPEPAPAPAQDPAAVAPEPAVDTAPPPSALVAEPPAQPPAAATAPPAPRPAAVEPTPARPETALAVREPDDVLAPPPGEYERQLDPRSMREARLLAQDMHASRMFSAYGSPQAVLSTVMVGRELGLPAMASLRSVHNIEGKHSLSASLMVAIVLKSGFAEYFEPVSFSETEATFETHRKGARNPVRLTHTIEMARQAWPKEKPDWEKKFLASGWGRHPTDMLVARATARLARMVYPDLLAGLYTPDELAEIREQAREVA